MGGKTLVNSSKSDFMGTEDARQTFSKFHSNHQNCNEPKHYVLHCVNTY